MGDQRGFDGVVHTSSWRGPPGLIDLPHTPQTSTKARRLMGTPAGGVEKVSSEECMAAWSLIRWGGPAAVLGGLSTTFVRGVLAQHLPRFTPLIHPGREGPGACRRGHRHGDGSRADSSYGADLLLDALGPLGGCSPPAAKREPPRGGGGRRSSPPQGGGRVWGLSG